jgi:hypothetical protein
LIVLVGRALFALTAPERPILAATENSSPMGESGHGVMCCCLPAGCAPPTNASEQLWLEDACRSRPLYLPFAFGPDLATGADHQPALWRHESEIQDWNLPVYP